MGARRQGGMGGMEEWKRGSREVGGSGRSFHLSEGDELLERRSREIFVAQTE